MIFKCFFHFNEQLYETLGNSELLPYQPIRKFDTSNTVRLTISTPMFYDRMLGVVYFDLKTIGSNPNSFLIM